MQELTILRLIWWGMLGILLIGFALTDGFDLGIAILFPWAARTELERRIVLNILGPIWEGNQVWMILGAGAMFAAWPLVYAVFFSSFYLLILLLLLTMGIARPVSFKYRSKLPNLLWRRIWDGVVFLGGVCPSWIMGLIVGNLFLGVPFYFDPALHLHYTGSFASYWHPFALLCGVVSLAVFSMHGGLYLAIKTQQPLQGRAVAAARLSAGTLLVLLLGVGYWITRLPGYQVVHLAPNAVANPLLKVVRPLAGAWVSNYWHYPWVILVPGLGLAGLCGVLIFAGKHERLAFWCSSMSISGLIVAFGISLFPFLIPSAIDGTSSLLVWDASSSALTLLLMLVASLIFMPLILCYTAWVYHVLRGKVTGSQINSDQQHIAY